jgi:hypothetical protein
MPYVLSHGTTAHKRNVVASDVTVANFTRTLINPEDTGICSRVAVMHKGEWAARILGGGRMSGADEQDTGDD